MTTVLQVDQYSVSVPAPDSFDAARISYTVNGATKSITLSREGVREQTAGVKNSISQIESKLGSAGTNLNQAQENLNRATTNLNQITAQKPVYSRNINYTSFSKQEVDYNQRLALAQSAVETAKKSIEQASVIRSNYQNDLTKERNELLALQDITNKFNNLQQASISSQLAAAAQLKKEQENAIAATQQAADALKPGAGIPGQAGKTTKEESEPNRPDPIVGPFSDNSSAAAEQINEAEIERILSGVLAKQQAEDIKSPVTLDQTQPTARPGSTIAATDDTTKQSTDTAQQTPNKKTTHVPFKKPEANPLHQYVNYTYSFSLFALTHDDYNQLSQQPKTFRPGMSTKNKQLLISSAGKYKDFDAERNSNFTDDFYFDAFKIETTVGPTTRGRGTNVYDISFTVVEPMGFTLFNRLLNVAKEAEIPNYLQMPFLLKIDFFGSNNEGEPVSPIQNQTKMMAIRLNSCKTQVSLRGTEYQFQAVPFHHEAFNETIASVPINLSVTAATVEEFFNSSDLTKGIPEARLAEERRLEQDRKTAIDNGYRDVQYQLELNNANKTFVVQSYAAGINSWLRYLKEINAHSELSEIEFQFDKEFSKSKIVVSDKQRAENAIMLGKVSSTVNPCADKNVSLASNIPIFAGTDVLKVIDLVMQNSEFIRSQPIDPKIDNEETIKRKKDSPMIWYKVSAQVELKNFDNRTNKWSKKIIYVVKKYEVPNAKHSYGSAAMANGTVKRYDYIYTGQNNDIIDLKLDFDMTFYLAVSVGRNKTAGVGTATQGDDPASSKDNMPRQVPYSPQPQYFVARAGNQTATAGSGDPLKDSVGQVVADIAQNIYSSARGDMINVELKIIGDPEFIKQDDLFLHPAAGFNFEYKDQYASPVKTDSTSGTHQGPYSLNFDSGIVLVQLNFNTPTDYDEETGMLRYDGKYTIGTFNGVYQLVTVTSEFRQGKFEQLLRLVRMFDQDDRTVDDSTSNRQPVKPVGEGRIDPNQNSDAYWATRFRD